MRVYIIEYRRYDRQADSWSSKVSQDGYRSLQGAQDFIERKPNAPVKVSAMYYQTPLFEEYYIHDILIK